MYENNVFGEGANRINYLLGKSIGWEDLTDRLWTVLDQINGVEALRAVFEWPEIARELVVAAAAAEDSKWNIFLTRLSYCLDFRLNLILLGPCFKPRL